MVSMEKWQNQSSASNFSLTISGTDSFRLPVERKIHICVIVFQVFSTIISNNVMNQDWYLSEKKRYRITLGSGKTVSVRPENIQVVDCKTLLSQLADGGSTKLFLYNSTLIHSNAIWIIARSALSSLCALFRSCPFVRPFVRSFVRFLSDFYQ